MSHTAAMPALAHHLLLPPCLGPAAIPSPWPCLAVTGLQQALVALPGPTLLANSGHGAMGLWAEVPAPSHPSAPTLPAFTPQPALAALQQMRLVL